MYEQTGTLVKKKFREHLLPTMLTSMALSLATIIDGVIVGQFLGSQELAAIGLSMPLISCINIVYVVFGVGGMMAASIARGRRENEKANSIFSAALIFSLLAMGILLLVGELFMDSICLALAGGEAHVASLTADYMRPLLFTGPALMLSNGIALFMRADGKPKSSASVVIIANAVNLIFDFVLIKFMGVGIMGAGLSTTLGYVFGILVVLPYILNIKKRRNFRFVIPKKPFRCVGNIIKTGLPKGLTYIATLLRSMVLNSLVMMSFGTVGMSVMTVLVNSLTFVGVFVGGTGDTLLPIVGTLFGERDIFGIKKTFSSAVKVLAVSCVGLVAFFLIFPQAMGYVFGLKSEEEMNLLGVALRLFAVYVPFYAATTTLQNFYNTTGRVPLASTMAVLDGFAFVCSAGAALAFFAKDIFWLCFAISSALTLVVIFIVAIIIRKREGVKGILLLREISPDEDIRSFTIDGTKEQAVGLSQKVLDYFEEKGLNPTFGNRLAVAVEEMAVATAHFAHEDKVGEIDVMFRVTKSDILLRFRDNGNAFNPMEYPCEEADGIVTDGVGVLKKLASKITYTRQLGFNSTALEFKLIGGQKNES